MTEPERLANTARNLLRMSLACLDAAGEDRAAAYAQHALDIIDATPVLQDGEVLPDEGQLGQNILDAKS